MSIINFESKKAIFEYTNLREQSEDADFLFIKKDDSNLSSQDNYYANISSVIDFEEAKLYLKKLPLSKLPSLIIINISLHIPDLKNFRIWLSENFVHPIPVIYEECSLKPSELKVLFQLKLIDDVIKNDYNNILLNNKATFLNQLLSCSCALPIAIEPKKLSEKIIEPLKTRFFKRTFDILISLLLIVLLSPVFLLLWCIIKFTSKGPAIYKSKRAGEGFKVFDFYKFRTMDIDAENKVDILISKNLYTSSEGSPVFFKVSNDPRITKIGSFLRNTSLDELPQLFNVVKGDMSIVGNRPLPLYEANSLITSEWAERFMAPAGITGLWQISKRGKADMSNEERISLDIDYARNRSIRGDFKILFSTPSAMIQKQNH
jgi:lipopolysaccharide/colanic/teichoic acid biosynthesis glycosyltransferase